jgi:CDP-glycerol glycerophosphotransferase
MPEVSIIVPVYNVELYFDQCTQSLLNQTVQDIECVTRICVGALILLK